MALAGEHTINEKMRKDGLSQYFNQWQHNSMMQCRQKMAPTASPHWMSDRPQYSKDARTTDKLWRFPMERGYEMKPEGSTSNNIPTVMSGIAGTASPHHVCYAHLLDVLLTD